MKTTKLGFHPLPNLPYAQNSFSFRYITVSSAAIRTSLSQSFRILSSRAEPRTPCEQFDSFAALGTSSTLYGRELAI